MKTFRINTESGPVDLEQLGTFAHYLQNKQFRFVITRQSDLSPIAVTHRKSGKRVCVVDHTIQAACLGNIVEAAKLSLDNLVKRVGEARVTAVLIAAEA